MLLTVHDELIFECPEDASETVANIVKTEMKRNRTCGPLWRMSVWDLGHRYTNQGRSEAELSNEIN